MSIAHDQAPPILDRLVSVFHGAETTAVKERVTLGTMLDRMVNGTYSRAVHHVQHVLAHEGALAYKQAKKALPAFTPCCQLSTRERDVALADKLVSCTGLVHLDLDHLADVHQVKQALCQHPAVVFAFRSPSGTGLKVGIAASGISDGKSYTHAWPVVVETLHQLYPGVQVSADPQVKYVNALCFVSEDAACYVNPEAVEVVIAPPPAPAPQPYSEEADHGLVLSALYAIRAYDERDIWRDIGMALHSTGESWARSAWDDWSQQSDKYQERDQECTWTHFKANGSIHLGTLFYHAKAAGWQDPRRQYRETPRQRPVVPDMTGHHNGATPGQPPTEEKPAAFASALVSFTDLLALELPPLAYHFDWLINPSLTMIYGPAGVGKTNFMLSLAISLAANKPFLKWSPHHGGCGVLYVDGEMGLKELQDRAKKMAGRAVPEPLHFLPSELVQRRTERDLTLTTLENRNEIDAMLHGNPDLKVLILDNVSCLFPGIDEDKKMPWEPINAWLIRLRHRGITVLIGHHSGKGGQQRGTSGRGDHLNTIMALTYPPGHSARDGCSFHLHFEKSRGVHRDPVEPLDIRLEDMPEGLVWACVPLDASRTTQIELMLADGMPPRTIADELKITASYVYRLKRKLRV